MAEPGKYLIGESLREKLKSTIAKVDSIPFGGPAFRLPHGGISDGPSYVPKAFRVCTIAEAWPVETSKTLKFYGVSSTPNTVSVLNKIVSLPAPKSTATSRIVNIAKDGNQWYLVSFQMSSKTAVMATATQTITFIGGGDTQAVSFLRDAQTRTLSYVGAGPEVTLTYVPTASDVDVISGISATLDTNDCKITINTTTTKIKAAGGTAKITFKTAGPSQSATVVSSAGTQTAAIVSLAGTQTVVITTGTQTFTYVSLEI